MAFPTYPYGYQPQYYPQPVPDQLAQLRQQPWTLQNPQQPLMQTQLQPVQQASAHNNGINWVGSKQEADNYPIGPGCAVALWDSNNPVIYLRQADSTGKPSTKVYDLVERTDIHPQQYPVQQIDPNKYVTWDKLDEYLAERLKRPSKTAVKKEETDNG